MKRAFGAGVALVGALAASSSAAAPCVAVTVRPGVLGERGQARLVEQLGASLAQHDIATCAGQARGPGAAEAPIAEVDFEPSDGTTTIRVRDAVTRKEITRVVRTGAIPPDGRPLALAIGADELLRASWAEILLARAPDPPPPPPKQVRAVIEASVAPVPVSIPVAAPVRALEPAAVAERPASAPTKRGERRFFLGVALAGEHATGGLTLGGVDARLGFYPVERLGLSLRLGGRVATSVSASDGTATARALLGGLGGAIALLPRGGALGLEIPVRVDVEAIQFEAHPAPGAHGSDAGAVAVTAASGLVLGIRLAAAWRLDVEATVGAALRPVEADDGTAGVASLAGAILGGGLGLRGEI